MTLVESHSACSFHLYTIIPLYLLAGLLRETDNGLMFDETDHISDCRIPFYSCQKEQIPPFLPSVTILKFR